MGNLKLIIRNGIPYADSRQVAGMVDKQHAHLMRDIKGYCAILTESNFGLSDFFIENEYKDSTGRTLPCYLITKKGCDMVANKMTGEKGVLFTATYIDKFYQMEEELKNPKVTTTTKPHYRQRMISTAVKDAANTAKSLMKLFAVKEGIAQATAFKMIENAYAIDLSPVKQLIQPAKHITGFLTPTALGMQSGGKKAADINKKLMDLGLQIQEIGAKGKKIWRLTDTGKTYGEEFPYDAKSGHSGYQIKWNENVLSLINMGEGAVL